MVDLLLPKRFVEEYSLPNSSGQFVSGRLESGVVRGPPPDNLFKTRRFGRPIPFFQVSQDLGSRSHGTSPPLFRISARALHHAAFLVSMIILFATNRFFSPPPPFLATIYCIPGTALRLGVAEVSKCI